VLAAALPPQRYALSPDGTRLAVWEANRVVVRDLSHHQEVGAFQTDGQTVELLLWSPTGRWLLVESDGRGVVLQGKTAQLQLDLLPWQYGRKIAAAAFHPDDRRFITTSPEGTRTNWDVLNQAPGGCSGIHGHQGVQIAYSPQGDKTAIPHQGRNAVRVCGGYYGDRIVHHIKHVVNFRGLSFSPDGSRLAVADGRNVLLFALDELSEP
jgi:WD40 repeat protein